MKRKDASGVSRRTFIKGTTAAAAAVSLPLSATAAPRVAVRRERSGSSVKTIVNIFLRGGADGLSLCWPYGEGLIDQQFLAARPTIKIDTANVHALDNYFALPKALAGLVGIFSRNDLAVIPGSGLAVRQRSHFSAMDDWEAADSTVAANGTGWLGRTLQQSAAPSNPIRGMALRTGLPKAFIGGEKSLPIPQPELFDFPGTLSTRNALEVMYQGEPAPTGPAVAGTFATIDKFNPGGTLASNLFALYSPWAPANYGTSTFASGLKNIAAGIKDATVEVEIYEIDLASWDHHNGQDPNGTSTSTMYDIMQDLGDSLLSFYTDLQQPKAGGGTYLDDVTIVVESEFGRRVAENGNQGTDHGWGGCMFVIGKSVNGGVYTRNWQVGNLLNSLVDGDIPVTIDYRDVLHEILDKHVGLSAAELLLVLPGFTANPLGIM